MGGNGNMWGSVIDSSSAGLQAIVGRNAIGKAGQALQNGYGEARNALTDQYGQTQAYLDPYSDAGKDALGQLSDLTKNWQTFDASKLDDDAGYKFRLSEGNKALENSAAAKGSVLSGGQLKALAGYNQGLASQEYQAAYGRFTNDRNTRLGQLSNLAGMGLNASSQQANLSNDYGNSLANLILGKANARASETMGNYRNWQTQDSRAAGAWSGANFGDMFKGGGNTSQGQNYLGDWHYGQNSIGQNGGGGSSYGNFNSGSWRDWASK